MFLLGGAVVVISLLYFYWRCLTYCKTIYFRCILILQFLNVENLLLFNLAYFPGAGILCR